MTFNNYKVQYQGGVFLKNDHSNIYFFLPSTTYRSEKHNQYMEFVRLWPIDVEPSDFGENFDPSKLDHVTDKDREKTRECVSKVLRKVVNLSNQNLVRNANCSLRDLTTSKIICCLEKKEKTRLRNLLFPIENNVMFVDKIYHVYL